MTNQAEDCKTTVVKLILSWIIDGHALRIQWRLLSSIGSIRAGRFFLIPSMFCDAGTPNICQIVVGLLHWANETECKCVYYDTIEKMLFFSIMIQINSKLQ